MTTSTRTRTLRDREGGQLTDALTQAQTAISQAHRTWGLWADAVCQDAEAAHGVGYDPADPVILTDDQYGDAPDLGTELAEALADVTALIDHLRRFEQRAAEDAR